MAASSLVVASIRRLRAQEFRRVLANMGALTLSQIASYILPLLLLPYTAAVLGPSVFGGLAVTQAIIVQCTMITNYGFPYSAVRQIALQRRDTITVAQILVDVWVAKGAVLTALFLVSSATFAAVPYLRSYAFLYYCGFVSLIGTVLYPDFFFQGVEEMKWITVINVVPKTLILPLVFVFVRKPSDAWKLLAIQSINSIVGSAFGALLVKRWLACRLPRPQLTGVGDQLKRGWLTFLSCASVNFNGNFNVIALGMLTNTTVVGYFSAAQRIVTAVQLMWNPISQALFPFFCSSFNSDRAGAISRLKRLSVVIVVGTLIAASGAALIASVVISSYLGPKYISSVPIFQVLIFLICTTAFSNLSGLHGLLGAGFSREYARLVGLGVLANGLLGIYAIHEWGAIGLSLSTVLLDAAVGAGAMIVLTNRCAT